LVAWGMMIEELLNINTAPTNYHLPTTNF